MRRVKVYVSYKPSVLDPQGAAVKGTLHRMGYPEIADIRIGKYFDIQIAETVTNLEAMIEAICDQLLVNVNMETYEYELVEESVG
ncbi:phosphoribosylformylglycinamidine synthase subunit PurS [Enterococcus faecalis]